MLVTEGEAVLVGICLEREYNCRTRKKRLGQQYINMLSILMYSRPGFVSSATGNQSVDVRGRSSKFLAFKLNHLHWEFFKPPNKATYLTMAFICMHEPGPRNQNVRIQINLAIPETKWLVYRLLTWLISSYKYSLAYEAAIYVVPSFLGLRDTTYTWSSELCDHVPSCMIDWTNPYLILARNILSQPLI